jgi:hypothetical protein
LQTRAAPHAARSTEEDMQMTAKQSAHQSGVERVPDKSDVPPPPVKDHSRDAQQLTSGEQAKEKALHYLVTIPRKLRTGEVLVHNHVKPQAFIGLNGFRAWTQEPDDRLEPCDCNMGGMTLHGHAHYRIKRSLLPTY